MYNKHTTNIIALNSFKDQCESISDSLMPRNAQNPVIHNQTFIFHYFFFLEHSNIL